MRTLTLDDLDLPNRRITLAGHQQLPRGTRHGPPQTRWKALRRVTLCPNRIGDIVKAAPVLTRFEHNRTY